MRIAITLRGQTEYEHPDNEHTYAPLSRRQPEFLPYFIELETPGVFHHELVYKASSASIRASLTPAQTLSPALVPFAAVEPKSNDNVS